MTQIETSKKGEKEEETVQTYPWSPRLSRD